MTDERRARILEVADALEAQGLEASNSLVYAYAQGHRPHVSQVMKERRAQRAAALGGVLVAEAEEGADAEEEPAATEAATLAEDLRQLEASYEAWHLALERLWEIEQDGPLSEAHFGRKTWLEYQLTANLQTQERLRGKLTQAQVTEAVLAAQAHHAAAVPEGQALVEQTVNALLAVAALLPQLAAHFDAQQTPLVGFRDRQGSPAFPWLAGGASDAEQVFVALYNNDPRALDAFRLLQTTLTVGHVRDAMAACARLQPFPFRAITNYLQPFTTEEGMPHANGR